MVSSFAGDDRVAPYRSSPADILERFFVPGTTVPPAGPSVLTQAIGTVPVGQPFSDTALVQGTVPTAPTSCSAAMGRRRAEPDCTVEPAFTSDRVPVDGAGFYRSGDTTASQPGTVYWVETLYGPDDQPLVAGACGAGGESTIVTPPPLTVTTDAVAQVQLGSPATDTATVAGTVPEGAYLVFRAYRMDDGTSTVCTSDSQVADTSDTPIPGHRTRRLHLRRRGVRQGRAATPWIEYLYSSDDVLLHAGACGADHESTTVTAPAPPAASTPARGSRVHGLGCLAPRSRRGVPAGGRRSAVLRPVAWRSRESVPATCVRRTTSSTEDDRAGWRRGSRCHPACRRPEPDARWRGPPPTPRTASS